MSETTHEIAVHATPSCILPGTLDLPEEALGIVLFAHGSGSSRHSSRNRHVAQFFERRRLGTLLIDLLSEAEGDADRLTAELRFDIELLASRLAAATAWLLQGRATQTLPIGYFGASTGAAAALVAAARSPVPISAVVSRGGRPDLAGDSLDHVRSPTLLIVGGDDAPIIDLNKAALKHLRCETKLVLIPGATHLFEEPGALDEVAELASNWFLRHTGGPATTRDLHS